MTFILCYGAMKCVQLKISQKTVPVIKQLTEQSADSITANTRSYEVSLYPSHREDSDSNVNQGKPVSLSWTETL